MKCDSCGSSESVSAHESNVMPTFFIFSCGPCSCLGAQPRWLIISAIKSTGITPVIIDIIKKKRYFGDPITAVEIL